MTNYHSLKISSCFHHLGSRPEGLEQNEAEKNQRKYGSNALPKSQGVSPVKIFFSQFNNALIYVLLFTVVLSFLIDAMKEAYVIIGAIVINVIIGYFQENKANRAIDKLKELVEHKALVLRGGREIQVDSSQVAVGDVIMIKAGNRIPADGRIFEAAELLVDESMLTGESVPSHKKTETVPRGAALADRENMVYGGTVAVNGLGRAVVTAVGTDTEIGRIAELVRGTEEEKTPLQLRLMKFSRLLAAIFGVVCVLIVIAGLVQGREFSEMIRTGVAVGVASIPEGLVLSVTFILALGMQRILKEKALTRKLVAAETLGSTTVIASDKTGTLTEGKMHVAHIVIGENEFELETLGSRQEEKEAQAVSLALQAGMMCNDAKIENPEDELAAWRLVGSPTEAALLSAAIQSGLNREKILAVEPLIDELPFDSQRKFMISLHRLSRRRYIIYEKGAPEIILAKANKYYHQGKIAPLGDAARELLSKNYEKLTGQGLRVVGLAVKEFNRSVSAGEIEPGKTDWEEIDQELVFVGFIAIKDPLRKEAAETIRIARQAGIRPVIITGDHRLTAQAIAREAGLKAAAGNIMTGEELEKTSDEELAKLVDKVDVYSRVSPHHKLRIVKALQSRGEVVAMTGDGINDAPALKAADIGISLGNGTDIAKETSDIILLDSNFKTIVSAVRQGRIIFKDFAKS